MPVLDERHITARRAGIAALAAVALLWAGDGVSAQANGDPGAAMDGQIAAQKAMSKHTSSGPKSGANAMSKGASGGTGGPSTTGGSNALSGTGQVDPKSK